MNQLTQTAPHVDPTERVELLLRDLRAPREGLVGARGRAAAGRSSGRTSSSAAAARRWPRELAAQFTHPLALLLWAAAGARVGGRDRARRGRDRRGDRAQRGVRVRAGAAGRARRRGARRATCPPHATRRCATGASSRRGRTAACPATSCCIDGGRSHLRRRPAARRARVEVDLSTLTGESLPVLRSADAGRHGVPAARGARPRLQRHRPAPAGEARAVVYATGDAHRARPDRRAVPARRARATARSSGRSRGSPG